MQRILHVTDHTGDTRIDMETGVDLATGEAVGLVEDFFDNLLQTGHMAFEVFDNGERNQLFKLNPDAETIVVIGAQAGG